MIFPLRNLLVLLVALCLAIPTICDEGGENNGGTGVWILPACANITAPRSAAAASSRGSWAGSGTSVDVKMAVASEMGAPSAMLVDEVSGVPIALPTSGRMVTISKNLLQALHQASVRTASVVITDTMQRGYILKVNILLDGKVNITIR